MAGPANKKRRVENRAQRPAKKPRRQKAYHSSSEDEEEEPEDSFQAVDLMDSDDNVLDAEAAGVSSDGGGDLEVAEKASVVPKKTMKLRETKQPHSNSKKRKASEGASSQEEEDDSEATGMSSDEEDDEDGAARKSKSKRNDPSAFATSLSKILSTKLSTSRRNDPVLARSAEAHDSSKAAVDTALEAKARRQLRDQKRRAMEKGRVKDVLLATNQESSLAGEEGVEGLSIPAETTADVLATEKRLRKTAQRGVVKLFNAVRAAQVKATEAEKDARKQGMIGIQNRQGKVNELSKKGFLELIASGGGGLKKGPIEEA